MFLEALRLSIPALTIALEQFVVVNQRMTTNFNEGKFTNVAYNFCCLEIQPGHAIIVGIQLALETDPSFIRTKGLIGRVSITSPSRGQRREINNQEATHPIYYEIIA